MRWEWDDNGDSRVADLWHFREQLSRSGKVVYSKWYKGRATFFSKALFAAMLGRVKDRVHEGLYPEAEEVLEILSESSPLSTKELKRAAHLEGKFNESTYTRTMKQLFSRFLVVGYGEVDDGAFPSLAMGATQLLFEDVWNRAHELSAKEIQKTLSILPDGSSFKREYDRLMKQLPQLPLLDEKSGTPFALE